MKFNIFLLFIFIFTNSAYSTPHNLVKVKKDIEISEVKLKKILSEKEILESELEEIKERIQIISNKKKALNLKLRELAQEIETSDYNLKILEKKQIKLREANRARFVRAYKKWKLGRKSEMPSFFNANLSFDKQAYYYKKIQNLDRKILSIFVENEISLNDRKEVLVKLIDDQDLIELNLAKEKKELNKNLQESESVLRKLGLKSREYEDELIDLRGKALRFEIALKALIDKSAANSISSGSNSALTDKDKIISDEDNELKGLSLSYLFPLKEKSKLKTSYGKEKVQNLNDYMNNKGVSVVLLEDSKVRAISKGRVVFVGKMPLYEKVVILHHGSRDYSLYAKLEGVEVSKGDEVSEGEIIASDIEGSEFYFEIRKNNKHINPKKYIKNWNDVVL